ncbi:unnamed protein product [Phaeothamnion confervicola]
MKRSNQIRHLLYEGGVSITCCGQDAIVMEDRGAAFTYVSSDNRMVRHLTRYCPTAIRDLAAAALRFCNRHSRRPFLCERLAGTPAPPGCPRAAWSSATSHCRVLEDGSVILEATGGNASLRLHPLREEVEARFSVRVPGTARHVWVEQAFLASDAPECFRFPLSLARSRCGSGDVNDVGTAGATCVTLPLPQPEAARSDHTTWTAVADSDDARLPLDRRLSPTDGLFRERRRPAQPPFLCIDVSELARRGPSHHAGSLRPIVEHCAAASLRVLLPPASAAGAAVAATPPVIQMHVQGDGSQLVLDGNFLLHRTRRLGEQTCVESGAAATSPFQTSVYHVEAADAVRIPYSRGTDAAVFHGEYRLGPLATLALRLREQYQRTSPVATPLPPSGLFREVFDTDVQERARTDAGTFTAYRDGRVSARFRDRTLLHVSADGSTCRAVLPDAREVTVASHHPGDLGPYLAAAAHFGRWAIADAGQRRAMAAVSVAGRTAAAAAAAKTRRFVCIAALTTGAAKVDNPTARAWAVERPLGPHAVLAELGRNECFLRDLGHQPRTNSIM